MLTEGPNDENLLYQPKISVIQQKQHKKVMTTTSVSFFLFEKKDQQNHEKMFANMKNYYTYFTRLSPCHRLNVEKDVDIPHILMSD